MHLTMALEQNSKTWNSTELDILQCYAKKYKAERTHKAEQAKLVEKLMDELELVTPGASQNKEAVKRWLANNTRQRRSMVYQVHKKPTVISMVKRLYKEQIVKRVTKKYGLSSRDKAFLGTYAKVASSLSKNLTKEQSNEVDKARARWRNEGPPAEARTK